MTQRRLPKTAGPMLTCIVSLTGLFPAIFNLASNAVVSSNATCGDPRPEVYCKLVEHVPGQRLQNPHCARCHAHSLLPRGTCLPA